MAAAMVPHRYKWLGRTLCALLVAFGAIGGELPRAHAGRTTKAVEAAALGAVAKAVARSVIRAEERKLAGQAAGARISAATRAEEIHSALPAGTRGRTTTAVTETSDGTRVVSSSENRLRPAQRQMLHPGEVEGTGPGHAEVTGINAARAKGLKPTETAASRPICPACRRFLEEHHILPGSPLKAGD